MKIVINAGFGGFGLSHAAIMRYAELKRIKLYAWLDDFAKKHNHTIDDMFALAHYTIVPEEEYKKVVAKEKENPVAVGRYAESSKLYFSDRDIKRDDPILIQVIRELKKKANGCCASLKIITIPDGIEYEIEEYDGYEHIAEKHRTWR